MSEKNWQPGDVAMVTWSNYYGREGGTSLAWLDANECWNFAGRSPIHASRGDLIDAIRPLVVLDAEDHEQMDRVAKAMVEAMHRAGDVASAANGLHRATVAAALRNLANPKPRIEEPQGLGAVVEDADGVEYLRVARRAGDSADWHRMTDRTDAPHLWWREFQAVRVVNEGAKRGESA